MVVSYDFIALSNQNVFRKSFQLIVAHKFKALANSLCREKTMDKKVIDQINIIVIEPNNINK